LTRKVWIIPALVAVLTLSGILGARVIRIPTLTFRYDVNPEGEVAHVTLFVQGVRCYGTANFLREHIEPLPGLVNIVVYAGKKQVEVYYQSDQTNREQIISRIESPVMTKTGPMRFYKVVSWEDG
jgi:hypothetical protein